MKLGVNIDHIATLRNARGGVEPSIIEGAKIALKQDILALTMHLREDRRHIKDKDLYDVKKLGAKINLEMAAVDEIQKTALDLVPYSVCLVPERRQEITTEGGLDVDSQKNRLKEGLFQFLNASIPTWIVGGAVSLCENSEKYNTKINKFLSVVGGLIVGMYGSAALSNIITDPKDKYPDSKLTPKDALANIDDGIGALALAKIPMVEKLKIARFLPIVYVACGYRAGQSN